MATNIHLSGNLTRDPEIRYLADSTAMATFSIAVDRRWQDRTTGEWQEATSFIDVCCWRELGEHVAMSLNKGDRVVLHGRLEQRTWTTKEGAARSTFEVNVEDIGPSLRYQPVPLAASLS
jgi:single-strand DNA-binding protein